jgi:DUF4097 and DUF4098 domain-containing protein YvlB
VEGDIHVEGGRGQVDLHAVDGDVMVFGSEATVQAASVDGDVTLTDVSGGIEAQTVDGDVILRDAASDNVQAASVDGDIMWDGDIRDGGRYSFVTPASRNPSGSASSWEAEARAWSSSRSTAPFT